MANRVGTSLSDKQMEKDCVAFRAIPPLQVLKLFENPDEDFRELKGVKREKYLRVPPRPNKFMNLANAMASYYPSEAGKGRVMRKIAIEYKADLHTPFIIPPPRFSEPVLPNRPNVLFTPRPLSQIALAQAQIVAQRQAQQQAALLAQQQGAIAAAKARASVLRNANIALQGTQTGQGIDGVYAFSELAKLQYQRVTLGTTTEPKATTGELIKRYINLIEGAQARGLTLPPNTPSSVQQARKVLYGGPLSLGQKAKIVSQLAYEVGANKNGRFIDQPTIDYNAVPTSLNYPDPRTSGGSSSGGGTSLSGAQTSLA